MPIDQHAPHKVVDLIIGRWRSQVAYVGTALGVFDALDGTQPRAAAEIAGSLGADASALYRLLRALASLGLLAEHADRRFTVTAEGACLRADHPASLRAMTLLEEGPVHYAAWKHLAEIVRSGATDGFRREYGMAYWDYLRRDPVYARTFSDAMSSYSSGEAPAVRDVLAGLDLGPVLCDVGGSHGVLLLELLRDRPAARGMVLDLPEVIATRGDPGRALEVVADRIDFVGGDMFRSVPAADTYILKHILHDWSDTDCRRILSVLNRAAKPTSRVLLCEFVVPDPQHAHFAKLFDIHMMVMQDGRQRTAAELGSLLEQTGWTRGRVLALDRSPMSVVEAQMQ